jgi:hypothetical protein
MSAAELDIVIGSLLSLVVLTILVFALWPEQRIDVFRQQMFTLRDELWDFAADGKVSFEEPAYTLLRQLMNGFIRYAHNLTPYRTILSFLRWKYVTREPLHDWTEHWNRALSQLEDPEVSKALQGFHSRAGSLVLSQLLLSPGLLIVLALPVLTTAILYAQWSSLRAISNSFNKRIPMAFLEEEAAKS